MDYRIVKGKKNRFTDGQYEYDLIFSPDEKGWYFERYPNWNTSQLFSTIGEALKALKYDQIVWKGQLTMDRIVKLEIFQSNMGDLVIGFDRIKRYHSCLNPLNQSINRLQRILDKISHNGYRPYSVETELCFNGLSVTYYFR